MKLLLLSALAFTGCVSTPRAPRSSLARGSAITLAHITAAQLGGSVCTVAPTGSMRPVLDEHSVVTIEPAPWAQLSPGDIVLYSRRDGREVIHRLLALSATGWLVAGDANGTADPEPVTQLNYRGRVAAIFYTQP
jgi:signal peptidase I